MPIFLFFVHHSRITQCTRIMTTKQTYCIIALFLATACVRLPAQTLLHLRNGCHFDGDETPRDVYAYDPSKEATQIVSRITAAIGLEQNFVVKAADVSNALANTEGGQRYILYNTTFLENFKRDAQTKWAAYCVLAHEIGHHLNNHDFTEVDPVKRKLLELAADRFAGNVLQKMGATLAEAQAGINSFKLDESKTHPSKSARLEAIAVGWKQSVEKEAEKEAPQYNVPKTRLYDAKKAQEWLNKAYYEPDDNNKVEYLTTALEYQPDNDNAWHNRGIAKHNLRKFKEAIADYDAAIRLKKNNDNVYFCRGWAKSDLMEYADAIMDYDTAIILNPNFTSAFNNRAWAKYKLSKDKEAIADYDQALRLDSTSAVTYNNRGLAKRYAGQYLAAIEDFNKAIKLEPKYAYAYCNKGCCLVAMNDKKRFGEALQAIDQGLILDNRLNYAEDCKSEAVKKLKE